MSGSIPLRATMKKMKKPNRRLLRKLYGIAVRNRDTLVKPEYLTNYPHEAWGTCYIVAEAYYHLEGKRLGYKPAVCRMTVAYDDLGHTRRQGIWDTFAWRVNHWYLVRGKDNEDVLDIVGDEIAHSHPGFSVWYENERGCGFLTTKPSRRAQTLMDAVRA